MEQIIQIHQDIHILAIGNLAGKILIVFQELIVIVAFVVLVLLQQVVMLVNVVIENMVGAVQVNVKAREQLKI
jgi:hypothetical protein